VAAELDNEPREEKGPAEVPVSIAAIRTAPISAYISSTANLVAENEVRVLAEVEGRIEEFRVEEGGRVARGEVLATLVRDDAEMALRKAELRAAHAKVAYERGIKAIGEKLLSDEDFERRKTEKEVAEQELAEARWQLDKRTIRAPFAGRITERNVQPGLHVKPGESLFTVADFDPLIARIHLPERDILGLAEGREARITLKADGATPFRGRIRQISPVVDTGTGTVKVTVEASEPPDAVRPGSFVTIDLVRETRPAALLVPREAVVRELQDSFVFVARNGLAERRRVQLGLEESGRIEILSGVAAGENVVTAGQGSLKHGTRIKVIPG
jgi:membrane fusion protein (multidrug efflux system)